MSVKLTSPVLGQAVGFIYTGNLESWLLAEGYAKRDADTTPTSYTGPGVANAGATDEVPANDPRLPANREAPYFPLTDDNNVTIANDATNLTKTKFPAPGFDVDPNATDDDPPANVTLAPDSGPATGGTVVTLTGDNLAGVTSVTFGGAAGTALNTTNATKGPDGSITVTTPAGTAGAVDVVLVDPSGNLTLTGGFTYTA